jgi:hypothetical protein
VPAIHATALGLGAFACGASQLGISRAEDLSLHSTSPYRYRVKQQV